MRQMEERAERDKILRSLEENKRIEDEQKQRIKQNSLRYQQGNRKGGSNGKGSNGKGKGEIGGT